MLPLPTPTGTKALVRSQCQSCCLASKETGVCSVRRSPAEGSMLACLSRHNHPFAKCNGTSYETAQQAYPEGTSREGSSCWTAFRSALTGKSQGVLLRRSLAGKEGMGPRGVPVQRSIRQGGLGVGA